MCKTFGGDFGFGEALSLLQKLNHVTLKKILVAHLKYILSHIVTVYMYI